jgi:hypothetical protein
LLAGGRLGKGDQMRPPKELFPERSANALAGAVSKRPRTHLTEERKTAIKLEDGSLIKGKINILSEPDLEYQGLYLKHSEERGVFYRRISDIFTKGKNPFIVVFDATIEGRAGRVLVINKNKILWISPED